MINNCRASGSLETQDQIMPSTGVGSCGRAAYEPGEFAVPIAVSEVVPSPSSWPADLRAQVEQPITHHDGDMRAPRRTVRTEQGKVQIRCVVYGRVIESGVIP